MRSSLERESVRVRAPAKINLGLEILGQRRDGFHEVRSVLAMIDVCDNLCFGLGAPGHIPTIDGVPAGHNLIDQAISLLQSAMNDDTPISYSLEKRIPIAAGLGGASADAAATLAAVNHLHGHPLDLDELTELASKLGTDVPFFLGSPMAHVKGTGTAIERLPVLSGSVLLIVPDVRIPRKTASLYALITERDFSSGRRVARLVQRLDAGLPPDPDDLKNAFLNPLYELVPDLARIPRILEDAGCSVFGLSGAGPTHYALVDPLRIAAVASRLEAVLDRRRFQIIQTSFLDEALNSRINSSTHPRQ